MSKFYGHLSNDEREILVLENTFNLDMLKLSAQVNAICEATAINMGEAENKVMMESGTVEDLDYLYEEAVSDANTKSGNIISKIISKIKTFVNNIIDKIKSLFTKEKAEELKKAKEVKDLPELGNSHGKLMNLATEAKNKITKIMHGGNINDSDVEEFKSKAKK